MEELHDHTSEELARKRGLIVLVDKSQIKSSEIAQKKTKEWLKDASKGLLIIRKDTEAMHHIREWFPKVSNKKLDQSMELFVECKELLDDNIEHLLQSKNVKLWIFDLRGREGFEKDFLKLLDYSINYSKVDQLHSLVIDKEFENPHKISHLLNIQTESVHDQKLRHFIPEQSSNYFNDERLDNSPENINLAFFGNRIGRVCRVAVDLEDVTSIQDKEILKFEEKTIPVQAWLKEIGFIAGTVQKYGC